MITTSSHTHPNGHIKASSTCIPFCLKTEIFSLVWPTTVHTYPVKTVTENASFQKRFPEWRFLKTPTSRLRVNGRKRRFSNKMMSYIIYLQHNACTILSYFHCFSFYVWTDENNSNSLRAGAYFLKKEEKISFFKNIRIRMDSPSTYL